MNKLVVVIPALNEENLIVKTLDSLAEQTVKSFSVIVVDNGSSDHTIDLVTKYSKDIFFSLTLLNEAKKGVGYARDLGSRKAVDLGAIFIAGTDADTLLPPNWIKSIYDGFEKSQCELLSGECDPFTMANVGGNKVKFVLTARSLLFRKIKPYFRGANFAITSEMFIKSGGFKQPLTDNGDPAPGEDGGLEVDALCHGAHVCGCLSTVFPHPRRYISNLQKITEFNGSVHEGGVVTQIRNETDLENSLKSIPTEVLDTFADKVSVSLFNEFVTEVYKNPVLRKIYWEKSLISLAPFSRDEIEQDISNNSNNEWLWQKYKETFFQNIHKWIDADVKNK